MATGGSIVWNLSVDSGAFTSGLKKSSSEAKDFGNNIEKSIGSATQKIKDNFIQAAAALAGLTVGFHKLTGFMSDSVDAANRQQAAFIGLNSVAKAFGQNTDEATEAARRLSSDGLMSVGEAAKGLKNLLASGFNLDQATKLMERFKDSAAFGRQNALTFGEAVASATEGIKNGNSILVDNAGVTKNLSVILKEAGFGADELMNATTDANVRLALFNGILKETNPQLGDAAKFANTAAGKQAMFAQKTEILKASIGEALQPALLKLLETLTPVITSFARFVENNPKVVSAVLIIGTVLTGLLVTLGAIGLAVTGLGPIFTAMAFVSTAAIGGVGAAFAALAGLLAAPLALPAIVVVAALASLTLVLKAVQSIMDAIDAMNNAARAAESTLKAEREARSRVLELEKTGTQDQRLRASDTLRRQGVTGYASGTNFAPGGMSLVGEQGPEIVNLPRGSEVIPNHEIGGSEIHIGTINISSEVDGRKWLRKLGRDQEIASNGLIPSSGAY